MCSGYAEMEYGSLDENAITTPTLIAAAPDLLQTLKLAEVYVRGLDGGAFDSIKDRHSGHTARSIPRLKEETNGTDSSNRHRIPARPCAELKGARVP